MKAYIRITGARGGDDLEIKVTDMTKACELFKLLIMDDWVLLVNREMEE